MKKILTLLILSFILIGCGGGGETSSSSSSSRDVSENFTDDTISSSTYDTWNYIIPERTSPNSSSISSRSLNGTTYQATFRSIEENNIVEEIPENTTDERVIYEKNNNTISVRFYKNDRVTYSYDMHRFVKIGEQTISNSSCMLVNHFASKSFNNQTYNDVIEIDCGQQKGYYAKGKGQIYQE